MFEWKIDDYKLYKEAKEYNFELCMLRIFSIENETSEKDKIDFVDNLTDGMLSYILNLANAFDKDSAGMRKDKSGNVYRNSLLAWLKKNDKRNVMITTTFGFGSVDTEKLNDGKFYFPKWYIGNINGKTYASGATHNERSYADLVFHYVLKDFCKKEIEHFESRSDYYDILTRDAKTVLNRYGAFGSNLCVSSDGTISVYKNDPYKEQRKLTVKELKSLVAKGYEAQKVIKELSKEHIEYD